MLNMRVIFLLLYKKSLFGCRHIHCNNWLTRYFKMVVQLQTIFAGAGTTTLESYIAKWIILDRIRDDVQTFIFIYRWWWHSIELVFGIHSPIYVTLTYYVMWKIVHECGGNKSQKHKISVWNISRSERYFTLLCISVDRMVHNARYNSRTLINYTYYELYFPPRKVICICMYITDRRQKLQFFGIAYPDNVVLIRDKKNIHWHLSYICSWLS